MSSVYYLFPDMLLVLDVVDDKPELKIYTTVCLNFGTNFFSVSNWIRFL